MKKMLTAVIASLVLVSLGCSQKENIDQLTETDQSLIPKNITVDESDLAQKTLITFFQNLKNEEYEEAVKIFDPQNGNPDSWEGYFSVYSADKELDEKATILKNYCKAIGTCLEAKVLSVIKEANDEYILKVQFIKADGSIFVLGPCCGATAEEMPPEDEFKYTVKKINGEFKVLTGPIFTP